jgi:guanosine-3',5'-bis(diphosphate) 3'-pyrophosphohydrolase
LIKLADKTCNIQDIVEHPPVKWSAGRKHKYLDWAESVVKKLRRTNDQMEQNFDVVLAETRKRVR